MFRRPIGSRTDTIQVYTLSWLTGRQTERETARKTNTQTEDTNTQTDRDTDRRHIHSQTARQVRAVQAQDRQTDRQRQPETDSTNRTTLVRVNTGTLKNLLNAMFRRPIRCGTDTISLLTGRQTERETDRQFREWHKWGCTRYTTIGVPFSAEAIGTKASPEPRRQTTSTKKPDDTH